MQAAAAAAVGYVWDSLRRVESGFDADAGCLAQAAYSVQAFDWSGGKETETTQDTPSLVLRGLGPPW